MENVIKDDLVPLVSTVEDVCNYSFLSETDLYHFLFKKNTLGVDFLKCSSAWCVWGTSACERATNYPVSKRTPVHPIFVVFIFPVMSCGSCGPSFAGACSPRFSAFRGCLRFEKLAIKQSHCCCMFVLANKGLVKRENHGESLRSNDTCSTNLITKQIALWSAAVSKTNLDVISLLCHALSCCKSLPSPRKNTDANGFASLLLRW